MARRVLAGGRAEPVQWTLASGAVLSTELARQLAASGAATAIVALDGLAVAAGDYVMPARSIDRVRAAWYTDARPIGEVRLEHATAIVGWRDGQPFAHCHALWQGARMGHLLNETVRTGVATRVWAWLFHGARFVARPDAETGFTLFVPEGDGVQAEAALLTVRPHQDLRAALEASALEAGLMDAEVIGLGSLIGARFVDAPEMMDPISEMLVLPGARIEGGRCRTLPVAVIDLSGRVHRGDLLAGPICVTGEFLLVGDALR